MGFYHCIGWIFICAAVLVFSWLLAPLGSHPHVFIEQRMDIRFDKNGLAGFKVGWTFDEMFSVMIAEDFDADRNGRLSREEVAVIREKAFGYIAPHDYYIHISIDGRAFPVKFITEFNAVLDKGKLRYEFFIPCHVRAVAGPKKLVVAPYDPEYFSDIYFAQKSPLTLVNAEKFEVKTRIQIDRSTSIYYDMVNPWAVFLNFRLKI